MLYLIVDSWFHRNGIDKNVYLRWVRLSGEFSKLKTEKKEWMIKLNKLDFNYANAIEGLLLFVVHYEEGCFDRNSVSFQVGGSELRRSRVIIWY